MRVMSSRLLPLLLVLAAVAILGVTGQLYASPMVLVEWETKSELDTVGFHLYRSASPDGPYERITSALIPASPDPTSGGTYRYPDRNVVPGTTYYYQLEDIETGGTSTRHGPIEVVAHGGWNPWGLLSLAAIILAAAVSTWRQPPRRRSSEEHVTVPTRH
ncbi:MAG: hypothetical protein M5U01_08015 [Ardenticatenaceae bacterium]|nr:hypothetical protein [Ardenticatenaceae bacterium]